LPEEINRLNTIIKKKAEINTLAKSFFYCRIFAGSIVVAVCIGN
jgi:hypothetical protein